MSIFLNFKNSNSINLYVIYKLLLLPLKLNIFVKNFIYGYLFEQNKSTMFDFSIKETEHTISCFLK